MPDHDDVTTTVDLEVLINNQLLHNISIILSNIFLL
jgi:hypothetical protein